LLPQAYKFGTAAFHSNAEAVALSGDAAVTLDDCAPVPEPVIMAEILVGRAKAAAGKLATKVCESASRKA